MIAMDFPIPEFNKEIESVTRIMKDAGKILLENYENPKGIMRKPDKSFVTDVDKQVSELIVSSLGKQFPEYGFLDEEHGSKNIERRNIWISDPLDGTLEYIEKTGDFGIIIGLVNDRRPVLGATYKPQKDELAYAAKGYGAYMIQNGLTSKLRVSDSADIHALVSRARRNEELEKMLGKIMPDSLEYMGGSLKTVEVAKGNATLFLCPRASTMSTWDLIPPTVILEEAGGRITDLYGRKIIMETLEDNKNHNGVVATNGLVHEKVLKNVSSVLKYT